MSRHRVGCKATPSGYQAHGYPVPSLVLSTRIQDNLVICMFTLGFGQCPRRPAEGALHPCVHVACIIIRVIDHHRLRRYKALKERKAQSNTPRWRVWPVSAKASMHASNSVEDVCAACFPAGARVMCPVAPVCSCVFGRVMTAST
jgi:hypothetical protein